MSRNWSGRTALQETVFVGCGSLASKFGIDDAKAVSFFDATCLTLAAAAMIGDACLHLIPETFEGTDEETADRYGVLLVTGVVAVLAFEKICDACNTGRSSPSGWPTYWLKVYIILQTAWRYKWPGT